MDKHSPLIKASEQLTVAVIAVLAVVTSEGAQGQSNERSGDEVVEAVCAACHRTGARGSPMIGDKKTWGKLASKGLTGLTQVALKGIRQMPSHGGNMALTDTEIKRAITYMVNQSGGHWTEPIDKTTSPAERSGSQVVQARCATCHEAGVGGAPKIADRQAWIPRIKYGLDAAVRSAIHGHGGMPPRGDMADLTDSEIRSAVVYMINKGPATAK